MLVRDRLLLGWPNRFSTVGVQQISLCELSAPSRDELTRCPPVRPQFFLTLPTTVFVRF